MKTKISSVSIIGSGNVATHLAKAFSQNQIRVDYVWSRNSLHAQALAEIIPHCKRATSIEELSYSDIILLCVSDDAIEEVAQSFSFKPELLAHTSGSTPLSVLTPYAKEVSVFYPLQTFSKDQDLSYDEIPICIEATSLNIEQNLMDFAKVISKDVRLINSNERMIIHLAAVFVSNFTNYLNVEATQILENKHIDRSILFPLMKEILRKSIENHPKGVQTGPAYRHDFKTIEKHLGLLSNNSSAYKIYQLMSELIADMN